MISFVHGILCEIEENSIVVEAGGLGYSISIPGSVLRELPSIGEEIKIFTHFSVREDGQSLYGFMRKEDREMFRSLLSVNGVGPKGALGILTVLSPDELRRAIVSSDVKAISRAQGIGAKTAQRIIIDLKDKVDLNDIFAGDDSVSLLSQKSGIVQEGPVDEAIEALTVLGYSRLEAGRAIRKINISQEMKTEDILKLALKNIKM